MFRKTAFALLALAALGSAALTPTVASAHDYGWGGPGWGRFWHDGWRHRHPFWHFGWRHRPGWGFYGQTPHGYVGPGGSGGFAPQGRYGGHGGFYGGHGG